MLTTSRPGLGYQLSAAELKDYAEKSAHDGGPVVQSCVASLVCLVTSIPSTCSSARRTLGRLPDRYSLAPDISARLSCSQTKDSIDDAPSALPHA